MKVAIAISGLPRKVEEGYNQFWKQIIEKYNSDVYLHFWEDEEYEKILPIYNPKKYISEKPFSFADYVNGLEADESLSRPTKPYDVAGNFRGFPMMHGWQKVCELVEGDYDYVIRGRYDLGGYCNLENVNFLYTTNHKHSNLEEYSLEMIKILNNTLTFEIDLHENEIYNYIDDFEDDMFYR